MKSVLILILSIGFSVAACGPRSGADHALAAQISQDTLMQTVKSMARATVGSGFNAGDGYAEVWIRDYNTFITLATALHPAETIKENLRVFFRLQGEDGNIVDGFVPKDRAQAAGDGYAYIYS